MTLYGDPVIECAAVVGRKDVFIPKLVAEILCSEIEITHMVMVSVTIIQKCNSCNSEFTG
jgi:hypothetical protein